MNWETNASSEEHDISQYKKADRGERLQRVLAKGGIGSRRTCEQLIEDGKVRVNGKKIDFLPAWVNPKFDRITVEDKKLNLHAEPIYLMYYKPRGVVSTMSDPENRPCVGNIVKHHSGNRIFPIGRLDLESQGLLLFTNDNILANKLMHPSSHIPKTYEVTVRGNVSDETIDQLKKGVYISDAHTKHDKRIGGKRASVDQIEITKHDRDRTLLSIELSQGRNRQIRRMLALVGHPVKRLRRTCVGPVKLKGLRPNQWRDLLPKEIIALKKAASLL